VREILGNFICFWLMRSNKGEAPPERPRRMRRTPQRIREDDSGGGSDGDDNGAMSSSDGAGSDGAACRLGNRSHGQHTAKKFAVGVHARMALKYWFKGTVTAMRMRRGEALCTVAIVDGTTENAIIDRQHLPAVMSHILLATLSR
jgi:hypothetical protein